MIAALLTGLHVRRGTVRWLPAVPAAVVVLCLAAWAQQVILVDGGLTSGGGTATAADVSVTGSLGAWHSTQPQTGAGGVVVYPGLVQPTPSQSAVIGDLDGDAMVGFTDFLLFATAFNTRTDDPAYNPGADFDSDGIIDFRDFLAFSAVFGG